jgi:O-methyltransferase involved in polyketide biosynthesis
MDSATGFDPAKPGLPRLYDFLLGGKDNFGPDRELARKLTEIDPGLPARAALNRQFLSCAVKRAAEDGVGQFADLGCGYPCQYWPPLHDAAREVIPGARFLYTDRDPVAVSHVRALQATGPGLAAVRADLADPAAVLGDGEAAGVIDLAQPMGVILGSVAPYLPPDVFRAAVEAWKGLAAPGSWLILSVPVYDDLQLAAKLGEACEPHQFWAHTPDMIRSYFGGLDAVHPGVCEARRWMARISAPPAPQPAYILAGAGVKPLPRRVSTRRRV